MRNYQYKNIHSFFQMGERLHCKKNIEDNKQINIADTMVGQRIMLLNIV